jgi:hypothetical protein
MDKGRTFTDEQRERRNAYNRERDARLRLLNIELVREKDRVKARARRANLKDEMREYDRARYAKNQEAIREKRKADYEANVNGARDKAIAYQKRRFSNGSMLYRITMALNAARARCKKRGIEFDLVVADLGEPTHCAMTGIPFDMSKSFNLGNIFCPSLDRIDPKLGYVRGNVRVVCHGYNLAKHTGSDADVLKLARALIAMVDTKERADE